MSIAYEKIRKEVALRSGQLAGVSQSTLEASYTGTWASVLDGAEVPISAFKNNILAVEKEIAEIIGFDTEQPYRNSLYGISSALSNGAVIPTLDANAKEFIGVFSGFVDGSDGTKVLTEMPIQTIEDLGKSFFTDTQFYHYKLAAGRVHHTRTTAKAEGCIWDYATQSTAYDAGGNSPLPQARENTWIAGVLMQLSQVSGWFAQEAQMYGQIYQQGIAMMKQRRLDEPTLPTFSGADAVKE